MKREEAKRFYRSAVAYVDENHPDELQSVRGIGPKTFESLNARKFLMQYCWVVYAAGFKKSILEKKFDGLTTAFHDFDIEKLGGMKSVRPALSVINHRLKAESFLKGAKQIYREGFPNFKARLRSNGIETLQELPYIGPITQKHLARNIGLVDVAKDDIWLTRLAERFEASSVKALTSFLAREFPTRGRPRVGVVDFVLWQYCADGGYKQTTLSRHMLDLR